MSKRPIRKRKSVTEQKREEMIHQRALKELEDINVIPFTNKNVEDDYLELPSDITDIDSRDLGRYFNAFTQQKMFVRGVIANLSSLVRELSQQLSVIKADVYSSLPVKTSVKEKEIYFSADDRARDKLEELLLYQEKLNMTESYIDSLEDAITLVSREISRRESDWEQSVREDSVSKKRGGY